MPYIAIKGYPKDDETKKKVVEKINQILLENWGCAQDAISISVEEVAPEKWVETVVEKEIEPNAGKMYIHNGEKKYR
ncbi:MAG: tautomerase family protein [Thermoguttaceae bacterium]|nr:tautomerase family protein [Thermoguttaceae bacterium]MBR6480618.1 tautomerase family protein [Thermoguttaceae bacterium]MCR5358378.1 tautomerase family protein [Thermoguttaceae bacterium]